ncbi:hypothetical protein CJ030_MR3G026474 [Morella rubra]|uniref:Thionin-like protein 2 n=1 Tax=Morella rubra TaxID=262757 RepID=A0A6A1W024_9ROSI|nr:hypothetical protein CJ030_MR3G026474 [Morella rubra]
MEGSGLRTVGLMAMVMIILSVTEVRAQASQCLDKCQSECALNRTPAVCIDACMKRCHELPRDTGSDCRLGCAANSLCVKLSPDIALAHAEKVEGCVASCSKICSKIYVGH